MTAIQWESIPLELLVEILGWAGPGGTAGTAATVCRHWHKATESNLLWKRFTLAFEQADGYDSSQLARTRRTGSATNWRKEFRDLYDVRSSSALFQNDELTTGL